MAPKRNKRVAGATKRPVLKRSKVSKEDRVKTRSALGSLKSLLMTPRTKSRYDAALKRFFEHAATFNLQLYGDEISLDNAACHYLEALWAEGDPRYWGEDVLSAIQKYIPAYKGCLKQAWALVSAWQRHELPQRCTPFSPLLMAAFIGTCLECNLKRMALCAALGFHCLLRTQEMCTVHVGHISIAENGLTGVLVLPDSKSGTRNNTMEAVTIHDAALLRQLRLFMKGKSPGDSLFLGSAHTFRQQFDFVLGTLALPRSLYIRPYSIRRGGATEDFRSHGQLDATCVRGRWANQRTCRIYINEAMMELSSITFSPTTLRSLAQKALIAEGFFQKNTREL